MYTLVKFTVSICYNIKTLVLKQKSEKWKKEKKTTLVKWEVFLLFLSTKGNPTESHDEDIPWEVYTSEESHEVSRHSSHVGTSHSLASFSLSSANFCRLGRNERFSILRCDACVRLSFFPPPREKHLRNNRYSKCFFPRNVSRELA